MSKKTHGAGIWRALAAAVAMCLVLLGSVSVRAGDTAVERYMLVAGANDGGQGRAVLRYAESDAARFAEVMQTYGGVEGERTVLLSNPDLDALREGFEALAARLAESSGAARREVVFYYSGHSDEQGLLLGEARLPYKELRELVDALGADVRVIVLDSCAAGALTRAKGGARRPAFLVDESTEVSGHAYLTSSSDDEVAQESDRIGGSFFTHYLVTGLRGAADVSDDQRVTLGEAYQFAFQETLTRTESTRSGAQHPVYEIQLTGTGDLVLTDLRTTEATLRLGASVSGRVYVHDPVGDQLVAELGKTDARVVELHLPAGEYTVLVEAADGTLGAGHVALEAGGTTTFGADRLVALSREDTLGRGVEILDDGSGVSLDEADDEPAPVPYRKVPFHVGLVTGLGINDFQPDDRPIRNDVSLNLLFGSVDSVDGIALSTLVGHVGLEMEGFQGSGLVSVASEVRGVQASGVYSQLDTLRGVQLGLANVAGEVRGAQLGLVNIGGEVDGAQIGLVNISDDVDAPIGLFNYASAEGFIAPVVYASDTALANVGVRVGTGTLYTMLSVGSRFEFAEDQGHDWIGELGLAVGARLSVVDGVFVDIDVQHAHLLTEDGFHPETLIDRLRVGAGYRFAPRLAVFAGASLNVATELLRDVVPLDSALPMAVVSERTAFDDVRIAVFPGFFGGVEF